MRRTGSTTRRPAFGPLASLWAALLIAFGLVAPVLAVEGPTKLFDPAVSPTVGLPTTTIQFGVTYRNRNGTAPDHVAVIIDGAAHAMKGDGSANWKQGVRLSWSTTLPVGVHKVSFEAADTSKFSGTIAGATVTIKAAPAPAPTPKPDPTPAPTPEPTPTPTAKPVPTPTSTPAPTGQPVSTTGSGSVSGPGGSGTSTDATNPSHGGSSASGGGTTGTDATGATDESSGTDGDGNRPDSVGTGNAGTIDAGAGGDTAATGAAGADGATPGGTSVVTSGPGWGGLAGALQALGVNRPPAIGVLPMLVGTTGAMAMAFAFAIFGKKRRDEQPPAPDEVLQANAARGQGDVPRGEVAAGVVRAPSGPLPFDAEAGMPRWRRPSLLEARKADPTRYVATTPALSFDQAVASANDARERRVIRYRVVRLLDAPDELRSAEIGQLDQGDEVQLLERSGTYWLVLCPDGRQGWLHKMTLGEIVTDAGSTDPWSADDVEDDVLSAFLQARARA
jgi:hypothetical protein